MKGLNWLVWAVFVWTTVGIAGGQIRLPGGVTIGDPRQGRQPSWPGARPERPDPDRVCPKMIAWIQVLQSEYPSVDLTHTMSGKLQQMAVPLFSDDVFQKEFGVSYSKLSDAERRDFFRTHVIPCRTSRQYAQQTLVLEVLNAPFQPGSGAMQPLSPGQLIPALAHLAAARNTLQADEQALAVTAPSAETYDRSNALPVQRKEELARVWPSEQTRFQGIVRDALARSATVAIQAKIQPLLTAPASLGAAQQLRDAPRTYATLFGAMPPNQQTELKANLDARRAAMLGDLLPAERSRAASFSATRQGLDDGADWFEKFRSVFLVPPVLPAADTIANSYLTHREAVLTKMASQLRQKIETTQDADTVATLYDDVFRLSEDRQTDTWRDLSAARATRAQLLTERADQARRAVQEREERAALLRGDIVASSLKTNNLQNSGVFRALYTGDAVSAGLSSSNILFTKMFEMYLIDFGRSCPKALPPNRVQMTYQECAEAVRTTVISGFYVNTSTDCVSYRTVNYEGAFADPRSYSAEQAAEKIAEISFVQDSMKQMFTNPLSIFSSMGDAVMSKATLEQDMPQLIEENGCSSKALVRLQENMTRLALGQDLLHLAGYTADRAHMTLARDLDIRDFANDVIRADATGWVVNHYTGLDEVTVVGDLDGEGRPRRIHATYSQQGATREGSVNITFADGTPACLYFADAPASCKTPNRSVVKRYQDGQYRRKGGR